MILTLWSLMRNHFWSHMSHMTSMLQYYNLKVMYWWCLFYILVSFISFFVHFRYNLAYIVFYLLGINTLIPWSFFMTADDVSENFFTSLKIIWNIVSYLTFFFQYWMYKFREINNSTNFTTTHVENLAQKTDLQASFTSYLSVASALPNTLFLIVNTFISNRWVETFKITIFILSSFLILKLLLKYNHLLYFICIHN